MDEENNLNNAPVPPSEPTSLSEVPSEPQPKLKTSKSNKKTVILIVVLVLLLAGAAAYWFLLRAEKTDNSQTNNQTNNSEDQTDNTDEIKNIGLPDTIPYAFRTADDKPFSVFWRPAAGGERVEVGPLGDKAYLTQYAVHGQQVVYATENESEGKAEKALWYSSDAGKTYSKLLELEAADQVTSLIFSTDGTKVVAAVLPESRKNTVKEVDPSTKAAKDLFTSEKAGIFLEGYSVSKQTVLYFDGCYNCDGVLRTKLLKHDLKTDAESTLIDAGEQPIADLEVRSDLEELVYSKAKLGEGSEFPFATAPYAILQRKLASEEETALATLNDHIINPMVGYLADGKTPAYSNDKQVFSFKDGKANLLFESSKAILGVFYVSEATVITAGGEFENFDVNNYDVAAKKLTKILSGDANTILFGVTTK